MKINRWWLLLLLLLLPLFAHAAPSNLVSMFTPSDGDKSIQMLANVFGAVGGVIHGVGSQIMGVMLGVFNSAVLALAGVITTYTMLVSTLNTAHEGEVMGRKWSSIWIPVRSAIGVALLLPKTTGYCFIQVFIMWVVVQGVGVADTIWGAALNYLANGGIIVQSSFQPTFHGSGSAKASMQKLLRSQICLYGLQQILQDRREQAIQDGKSDLPPPVPLFSSAIDLFTKSDSSDKNATRTVEFPAEANITGYEQFKGICGSATWEPRVFMGDRDVNPYQDSSVSTGHQGNNGVRTVAFQQVLLAFSDAASAVIDSFQTKANPSIGRCPDNQDCGYNTGHRWNEDSAGNVQVAVLPGGLIKQTFADYVGIMSPALRAAQNDAARAWFKSAREKGWIMAGSYYSDLAEVNDQAGYKMDSKFPKVEFSYDQTKETFCNQSGNAATAFSKELTPEECGNMYKWIAGSAINRYITDATDRYKLPNERSVKSVNTAFTGYKIANGVGRFFAAILGPLADIPITFLMLRDAQKSNENPLFLLSRLGYAFLNLVTQMWIAGLVLGVALTLGVGSIPCVTVSSSFLVAVMWLAPFITVVMTLLFAAGAVMAVYIPLIPYILFTFGSIGWLIAVIESMVAAPIVAIGILHPDGQHEILGKADHATMLILNIFLRPGMMVIGFIAGMSLSYVGIWLLNEGFDHAWTSSMQITGIGAIWIPIIIAIIYAGTAMAIAQKAFSLIHILPDKVLRWLSAGMQESFGADSAQEAQGIRGAVQSGASQMGGAMGKGAEAAATKGAQNKVEQDEKDKEPDVNVGEADSLQTGGSTNSSTEIKGN